MSTLATLQALATLSIIALALGLVTIWIVAGIICRRRGPQPEAPRGPGPRWQAVAWLILVLNFLAFLAGYLWLGGAALNGGIVDVQPVLGNWGESIPVSPLAWLYSLAHGWLTFVLFIVLFAIRGVRQLLGRA